MKSSLRSTEGTPATVDKDGWIEMEDGIDNENEIVADRKKCQATENLVTLSTGKIQHLQGKANQGERMG